MKNLGNRFSQHSFAQIPDVHTARSSFDRSYPAKDTFDFDWLVPCFVEEILPGDTINLNVKSFMRLAPQVKPLMDNAYVDFFFFFVPNRLVWENWEAFNGANDDASFNTPSEYLVPSVTVPAGGFAIDSVADHFGIPTEKAFIGEPINALPFRAYVLIYNEWFRDQNLIPKFPINMGDGPDPIANFALKRRAKKHDYFTSALPWPQKGQAIALPLSNQNIPISSDGTNFQWKGDVTLNDRNVQMSNTTNQVRYSGTNHTTTELAIWGNNTGLEILSDDVVGPTINQFRLAMMTQSLLELDARGGTRYVEILRAHWNVVSPDFRLQRPEFLASGTTLINQHPVTQTSESTTESPQGNLAAFSTQMAAGNQIGFQKSFVEHGFVIGLVNARGEVSYQQGINRMWSRQTRFDYFWPKLQELGEQTILNKELVATTDLEDNNGVFGYQERYSEYRYHPAEIRGQFRSTYAESLDVWHLAQEFSAAFAPVLNPEFINSDTPIERNLVVPDSDYPHLLADFWFDMKHARVMTTYGVPATLGRF